MDASSPDELARKYYLHLAAACVRGSLPDAPADGDAEAVTHGLGHGLRLHRFKRTAELPRVRRVLGILRGLAPESLLDVGSGRGAFLWPLLDAFPGLPIRCVDQIDYRVADIQAVARGGFANLRADVMDVCRLELPDDAVDVATVLEVLEHLPRPEIAVREILRVARRFVVASVPSKADDNPEHIQLFNAGSLEEMFLQAGAAGLKVEYVLNHMIAVVRVRAS